MKEAFTTETQRTHRGLHVIKSLCPLCVLCVSVVNTRLNSLKTNLNHYPIFSQTKSAVGEES
jgi:hypothetical protein